VEGAGWRQWIGFGVVAVVIVGLASLTAGWFVSTVFLGSCGC
jgi:hypothetical protein